MIFFQERKGNFGCSISVLTKILCFPFSLPSIIALAQIPTSYGKKGRTVCLVSVAILLREQHGEAVEGSSFLPFISVQLPLTTWPGAQIWRQKRKQEVTSGGIFQAMKEFCELKSRECFNYI